MTTAGGSSGGPDAASCPYRTPAPQVHASQKARHRDPEDLGVHLVLLGGCALALWSAEAGARPSDTGCVIGAAGVLLSLWQVLGGAS